MTDTVIPEESPDKKTKQSSLTIANVFLFFLLCGLAFYFGKQSGIAKFEKEL